MKKVLISTVSTVLLINQPVFSEDNGKVLHDDSCISCHMMSDHNALYTRENRVVKSKSRLSGQVSMCTQQLNVEWFPDEEKSVVEFLNNTYYKYK